MKRFRFRLESVLRWRQLQLELEEEKLQQRFAELRALEQRQTALEAARAEAERTVLGAKAVAAEELAALDAHRRWVALQRERLAQAVADCQRRIQEQRAQVRKAEQNLKLLEKLKERRLGQWWAGLEKEFQALGEETYLAQWPRER